MAAMTLRTIERPGKTPSSTSTGDVTNIQDLAHLAMFHVGDCVFRGERETDWDLAPKIDRHRWGRFRTVIGGNDSNNNDLRRVHEEQILRWFKRRARPFLAYLPTSDWEWLALGQHYGLATRLLDWTMNPLVALFFAVEEPNEGRDSVVWCYKHKGERVDIDADASPLSIKERALFYPPHVNPRIPVQAGIFTVHPTSVESWGDSVIMLRIPGARREWLRGELRVFDVDRARLFPGLDGAAASANSIGLDVEDQDGSHLVNSLIASFRRGYFD